MNFFNQGEDYRKNSFQRFLKSISLLKTNSTFKKQISKTKKYESIGYSTMRWRTPKKLQDQKINSMKNSSFHLLNKSLKLKEKQYVTKYQEIQDKKQKRVRINQSMILNIRKNQQYSIKKFNCKLKKPQQQAKEYKRKQCFKQPNSQAQTTNVSQNLINETFQQQNLSFIKQKPKQIITYSQNSVQKQVSQSQQIKQSQKTIPKHINSTQIIKQLSDNQQSQFHEESTEALQALPPINNKRPNIGAYNNNQSQNYEVIQPEQK